MGWGVGTVGWGVGTVGWGVGTVGWGRVGIVGLFFASILSFIQFIY